MKVTGTKSPVSAHVISGRESARGTVSRTEYVEAYKGPYEVEASDVEQTVSVKGMKMTDDIKIKPIPSNYGKIIWNGGYLTIV